MREYPSGGKRRYRQLLAWLSVETVWPEILDPTARIGDWHESALKFDSTADEEDTDDGRVAIIKETFDRIANPIDSTV